MRKLEKFKNNSDNLLSENELSKVIGGLMADTSRSTCFTATASADCSDTRIEKTIDENGTTTTTTTEVDN